MTKLDPARPGARAVVTATLAMLAFAGAAAGTLPLVGQFQLQYVSLFYKQFATIEPVALALIAGFAIVTLLFRYKAPGPTTDEPAFRWSLPRLSAGAALIAIAIFVIAAIGTEVVFHRFFLADDEYSAWFQAVIFSHGRRAAIVTPEWCRWITSLTPTSIAVPSPCTWRLSFLPIHSMIRSLFMDLHIDRFAGPTIGAMSIVLVVSIARKAWPDRLDRAWIAAAALGTSTQFLFTSMTMWAMPTHLLFSLIWLRLYLEDRPWSIALLPWIGFLALGVHSPVPHALLIPPFLIRYLRDRRWGVAAYIGAVYAVAVLFWAHELGAPAAAGAAGLATPTAVAGMARGLISLPSKLQNATMAMNLGLILTWNTPLASIAVLLAMLAWKRLDTFGRDLALSLILVLAVRAVDPGSNGSQGEGWGYRYVYAALGNFALLAACGFDVLVDAMGKRRAMLLGALSLATSLVIQLPMRGVQVERMIRPYYLASTWMEHLPAKIVAFPAEGVTWGRQLVRNDPFLIEGNKLMDLSQLKPAEVDELKRLYPGQVRIVNLHELISFGLDPWPTRLGSLQWIPQ